MLKHVKDKMEPYVMRIDPELFKKVEMKSQQEGCSYSDYVRRAIRQVYPIIKEIGPIPLYVNVAGKDARDRHAFCLGEEEYKMLREMGAKYYKSNPTYALSVALRYSFTPDCDCISDASDLKDFAYSEG